MCDFNFQQGISIFDRINYSVVSEFFLFIPNCSILDELLLVLRNTYHLEPELTEFTDFPEVMALKIKDQGHLKEIEELYNNDVVPIDVLLERTSDILERPLYYMWNIDAREIGFPVPRNLKTKLQIYGHQYLGAGHPKPLVIVEDNDGKHCSFTKYGQKQPFSEFLIQ